MSSRPARTLSWSVLATALLLAAAPRLAGAQAFVVGNRVDLATGGGASEVAIGDVNVDGKPDLVTVNASGNSVSVLLGNGAGGFSAKNDVPVAISGPASLALGDVNGDGKPDLAVLNMHDVSVLLGNGAGGFGAATVFQGSIGNGGEIKIADMTGDGRLDLVILVQSDGNVKILSGNGAGGFTYYRSIFVGPFARRAAIGDLNGDGQPDLCVLSPSMMFSIFVSLGFGYVRTDFPTTNGIGIAVGDVNRDGKLDVVTTNGSGASISVYQGNGMGALGAKTDYASAAGVRFPVLADMNGDGLVDLAFATSTTPVTAGVMLGNGAGAFAAPTSLTTLPGGGGGNPGGVAVGDVNGDGRPEIVAVHNNSLSTVLFNGTGGEFGARSDLAVGTTPRGVTIGDVNADGRPDLAVANAGSNTVSVLLGLAAGGFGPKTDFTVGAAPAGVAIGDVSGDGRPDLVVANSQSGNVSFLLGNGVGGFGARTDIATGAGSVAVVLADLNGDGRLDATVVNNVGGTLSVLPNNGAGGFGAKTDLVTGPNPASVAVGDLNADGLLDLVASNGGESSAGVFLGTGGGGFGARTDLTTGPLPLGVALGDVSGDGKLDLVVANGAANTASVLLGNGLGAFAAKVDYPVGAFPNSVAIGDVNGDGRADLSIVNQFDDSVSLLLGAGAGSFGPTTSVPVANTPETVAIGDLNGDGRLDLAVAAKGAAAVSVLLGLVPSKTTLSISANPIVAGSLLILSASVSVPAPGLGTPADSVRFFDGQTLLGVSPVVGGGAGLALFASSLGDRAIRAVYKGDGKLFGSISNAVTARVFATAAAAIIEITDVASDQGGQARLLFTRSPYDFLGSGIAITGYQVYRRAIIASAMSRPPDLDADPQSVQLAGWDYLSTVPATTDDYYAVVVPTLADSNGTGFHRTVLFVRATTASPVVYYDSPADSGYSVDNLAPLAPAALTAGYTGGATHLHWSPNSEHDFASYRVYRGASAGFVPGAGNLVTSSPDTGYADAGPPGSYYKVCAVDENGNQSSFALVGPDATTDVSPAGTPAFALERVRPNPSVASRLVISFSLPTTAPARLEVFDVRGRRVAAQDVGGHGAGRQAVPLSSAQLAPGIYLVKLSQGAASMTQRLTVVQ